MARGAGPPWTDSPIGLLSTSTSFLGVIDCRNARLRVGSLPPRAASALRA
jgi:hypothetical protein